MGVNALAPKEVHPQHLRADLNSTDHQARLQPGSSAKVTPKPLDVRTTRDGLPEREDGWLRQQRSIDLAGDVWAHASGDAFTRFMGGRAGQRLNRGSVEIDGGKARGLGEPLVRPEDKPGPNAGGWTKVEHAYSTAARFEEQHRSPGTLGPKLSVSSFLGGIIRP
jgi:hypothetical protein